LIHSQHYCLRFARIWELFWESACDLFI
jgi:hypothetical protein